MTAPKKLALRGLLTQIQDYWSPAVIAELNGQQVKLAKIKGEFDWHHHEDEDELFLVVKGSITIRFRDSHVELTEGEAIVVPKGVEHQPYAKEEAHVLLFEPTGTRNTGNVLNHRTKLDLPRI